MAEQIDVVVAGHICLDLIPKFLEANFSILPGQLTNVGEMSFAGGGCVSNVGSCLTKLAVKSYFMANVGNDYLAEILISTLAKQDAKAVAGLKKTEGASSYSIVISPPGFDRHFLHYSGCNDDFKLEDVDFDVLKKAKLLYFGYPPLLKQVYIDGGKALAKTFEKIKAMGLTIAMDMAVPKADSPAGRVDWLAFLELVLPYVDIFIPSYDEILFMLEPTQIKPQNKTDAQEVIKLVKKISSMGVAVAGIKLGDKGMFVKTTTESRINEMGRAKPHNVKNWANKQLYSAAFEVEAKNTLGAGDASYAGFISALLRATSLEESLTMACAVGASSVEGFDAITGVKSWQETIKRVRAGWARAQAIPELENSYGK